MRADTKTFIAAALCAVFNIGPVVSGEEFGREATGVPRISLTIHPNLQITDVDDIAIDVSRRGADTLHTEELCVRVNGGSSYFVMAHTDVAAETGFQLRNQDNQNMAFEVRYRSDSNGPAGELLQPNIQSRLQYSQKAQASCEGGSLATVGLRFPEPRLSNGEPGIYTGSLTLTVVTE